MERKEARTHLRSALAELNADAQRLKALTRVNYPRHRPLWAQGEPDLPPFNREQHGVNQAALRLTQRRLTVLHAMLAYSRGHIHPATKGLNPVFNAPTPATEQYLKTTVRQWIERHGENLLGIWWASRAASAHTTPALATVWAACCIIPDKAARQSAVKLGGPDAAYA